MMLAGGCPGCRSTVVKTTLKGNDDIDRAVPPLKSCSISFLLQMRSSLLSVNVPFTDIVFLSINSWCRYDKASYYFFFLFASIR
jgi:hypothetical protein